MNKNRIFALALSAAMLLSLTSCATQNESTYVPPAGVAVQVESVELTTSLKLQTWSVTGFPSEGESSSACTGTARVRSSARHRSQFVRFFMYISSLSLS